MVAILAFTVGYRTRWANLATWIFMVSVHQRNTLVCDSGDSIARLLLFWGMFADLGGRFCIDVLRGLRPPARTVPSLGPAFIQLQIALIYVATACIKLHGESWLDGTALSRALWNEDYSRPSGMWLATWPLLCQVLARLTLVIEASFPLLVLSPWRQPWARRVALLLGCGLHIGIFLTMKVGMFSFIILVSYFVYLDSGTIDYFSRFFPFLTTTGQEATTRPGQAWRWAALTVQLAVVVRLQLPHCPVVVAREAAVTGTWQNWSMFAPDPPYVNFHFTADGVDERGQPIDVLATVAPEFNRRGSYRYSRWYKLRSNYQTQSNAVLPLLGRYLCHRYNSNATRPRLVSFTLYADIVRMPIPHLPSEFTDQSHLLYLTQDCTDRLQSGP